MEGKRRATRVHLLSATLAHSLPPPRSVPQASHVASEETETQRKEASRRTSRPRLRTGDLGLGRGTGTCAQRDPRRLNAPPSPLAAVQVSPTPACGQGPRAPFAPGPAAGARSMQGRPAALGRRRPQSLRRWGGGGLVPGPTAALPGTRGAGAATVSGAGEKTSPDSLARAIDAPARQ